MTSQTYTNHVPTVWESLTIPVVADGNPLTYWSVAEVVEVGLHKLWEKVLQVVCVWEKTKDKRAGWRTSLSEKPVSNMLDLQSQMFLAAEGQQKQMVTPKMNEFKFSIYSLWSEFGPLQILRELSVSSAAKAPLRSPAIVSIVCLLFVEGVADREFSVETGGWYRSLFHSC